MSKYSDKVQRRRAEGCLEQSDSAQTTTPSEAIVATLNTNQEGPCDKVVIGVNAKGFNALCKWRKVAVLIQLTQSNVSRLAAILKRGKQPVLIYCCEMGCLIDGVVIKGFRLPKTITINLLLGVEKGAKGRFATKKELKGYAEIFDTIPCRKYRCSLNLASARPPRQKARRPVCNTVRPGVPRGKNL